MKTFLELYDELKEKSKGVYYYMNLRKKKGTSRPKGHPKAPSEDDLKRAAQTAKENVQEGPEEDEAKDRKRRGLRGFDAQIDSAKRRDMQNKQREQDQKQREKEQEKAQKERDKQQRQQNNSYMENAPSLAVLKKKIKSGTKLGSTETSSAKARGLIPRADGTKRKSPKYK